MIFGKRRPHRGDDVGKARLVEGDDVHVTFDDHRLVGCPDRLASLVQAEEQPALIEEDRLRRVQELGHILGVDDPSAEAGHAPTCLADGDHDAVAESVVLASALALARHPRLEEFFLPVALLGEVSERRLPRLRGVADLEGLQRLIAQMAAVKILEHGGARRSLQQVVAVEGHRRFQQLLQPLVGLLGRLHRLGARP